MIYSVAESDLDICLWFIVTLNVITVDYVSDGYTGACRTNSNSSISLGFITRGPRITESNTVILKYTGQTQGGLT